jgi:hypothetical protein
VNTVNMKRMALVFIARRSLTQIARATRAALSR